jgi:hypothetical protein
MSNNRETAKRNWQTLRGILPLPDPNDPEYHTTYMALTREVARLSQDPKFNAALNQQRLTFKRFLLNAEIGLTPKAKEFLNRDLNSFIKRNQK